MIDAKHQSLPMCPDTKLSLSSGSLLAEPKHYHSIIGALQYLTMTRSDIAFPVNRLCQYLKAPTTVHWSVCKQILQYLVGTPSIGLHFRPCSTFQLH